MKKEDLALIDVNDLSLVDDPTLSAKQIQMLLTKTPSKYIKWREGKGGQKFPYVRGGYIRKVLNLMFGFNWDFEIVDQIMQDGFIIVKGRLTCRVGDNTIVKMQYGGKEIAYKNDYSTDANGNKLKRKTTIPLDLGNDFKAAATDSLKKCAAEIGIANDVYNKEEFREVKIKQAQKDYSDAID